MGRYFQYACIFKTINNVQMKLNAFQVNKIICNEAKHQPFEWWMTIQFSIFFQVKQKTKGLSLNRNVVLHVYTAFDYYWEEKKHSRNSIHVKLKWTFQMNVRMHRNLVCFFLYFWEFIQNVSHYLRLIYQINYSVHDI